MCYHLAWSHLAFELKILMNGGNEKMGHPEGVGKWD